MSLPLGGLLGMTVVLLVFEIARANQPAARQGDWPWSVELLGIPTTASLLAASLVTLVAREQFARSVTPLLRYVSKWVSAPEGRLRGKADRYWQVRIRNVGPGAAAVTAVRWRVRTTGAPVEVTTVERLRDVLAGLGRQDERDFWLANYTPGTALAPDEERCYFECTATAMDGFAELDAIVEFESLLGDRYEKRISLLPSPGASSVLHAVSPESATA